VAKNGTSVWFRGLKERKQRCEVLRRVQHINVWGIVLETLGFEPLRLWGYEVIKGKREITHQRERLYVAYCSLNICDVDHFLLFYYLHLRLLVVVVLPFSYTIAKFEHHIPYNVYILINWLYERKRKIEIKWRWMWIEKYKVFKYS